MTLLVGLGNPGDKYKNNRHNVGFMLIDKIIDEQNPTRITKSSFQGELFKSQNLLLLKPTTFMNLSGVSIRAVSDYYKPDKIIVVHDDLDLPFGTLRFKLGGSSGGHNGLKSVDAHIGADYYRVRIGVAKPKFKEDIVSYVLADFPKKYQTDLQMVLEQAQKAALALDHQDLAEVATKYSLKNNFEAGDGA